MLRTSLWYIMRGETLPAKIESYFSAMKAPVMEVKWPVCSCLEN